VLGLTIGLKTVAISVGTSRKRRNKCLGKSKWIEVMDILSGRSFGCVLSVTLWEENLLVRLLRKCKTVPLF
jgi:hypothetical protein